MEAKRQEYLQKLIAKKDNGRIKVITGIRRSGKSFLLFKIFKEYLFSIGVKPTQIIELTLDDIANVKYRNPFELDKFIRENIKDKSQRFYVLIDEIQFVSEVPNPYLNDKDAKVTFIDVLLGLMKIENVDIYVTGSNSKMLSSDILTQFRDRGDEIKVFPLSYSEFYEAYDGDKNNAWLEYYTYGGMPRILALSSHEEKSKYLKDLFNQTYIKDVMERNQILNEQDILDNLLDIVASAVGSLTNPNKLSKTFKSEKQIDISSKTIERYLNYFSNAFLISKAQRYDVKGKKYISTPFKYYFIDVGLRNAKLNFRQQEENHIMENILYCELIKRGYDVDVGVVEQNGRNKQGISERKKYEIDFVINKGEQRYYIQSALTVENSTKRLQEVMSLVLVPDSFKKIVVVGNKIYPWKDENGILYIGIEDFLLNENAINM